MTVGHDFELRTGGETQMLKVSGIYQEVTAGGLTAKMQGDVSSGAVAYVVYADPIDGDPVAISSDYSDCFPDASVIPMRQYVKQTLSYITDAFRTAASCDRYTPPSCSGHFV